jgi:hypothetical protein
MARAQKSAAQSALAALGDNLDPEGSDEGLGPVVEAKVKYDPKERIEIQLEENEEIPPGGQFIGVNGEGYLLRPGQPAKVSLGIIEALNCMVMSVPVLDENQSVTGYRDRLRFPYRILTKGVARA